MKAHVLQFFASHLSLFYYHLANIWQVFADKLAPSVRSTGNQINRRTFLFQYSFRKCRPLNSKYPLATTNQPTEVKYTFPEQPVITSLYASVTDAFYICLRSRMSWTVKSGLVQLEMYIPVENSDWEL